MTKYLQVVVIAATLLLVSACSEAPKTSAEPESPPPPATQNADQKDEGWKQKLSQPAPMEFDASKTYYWVLETNLGKLRFKLLPETAPNHVTSTIYLTNLGFYDDLIFHRVISSFMAQGGDPTGTGAGGPGYQYAGEFSDGVLHDRPGLLSMANAGPGTDGSQFFMTFVPTPWLDGKHTIFGELVDGMETLQAIEARGSRAGQTSEKVWITRALISIE